MLAQVLNTKGNASQADGERYDPMVKYLKDHGCEHIYTFIDSASANGLVVLLWPDKKTMDEAAAKMAQDTAQISSEVGITVTPNAVYDVVTEL
jgi:hypothetical protein